MIYKILPALLFFVFAWNTTATKPTEPTKLLAATTTSAESKAASIYGNLHSNGNLSLPKLECFSKALEGYYELKESGKITKSILTVVDFSLSSNTKRLWVIDMATNTILYNSLVAHGKNTGEEFAQAFSNISESNKSSLGFYATGEVYTGKHGMSLKLDGLERGVNDNARNRAVVMHGADYVSESFIRNHHRLGRSQGCPAIPMEMTQTIINTIKDKSCLYIYHPSRNNKTAKLLS